ncbi:hypothetical protein [Phycisphaera mikurensis]|uniref:DUF4159 domain-containing protein n=1 Tax=Phycisphaera mikurensis (strain NBRC 102666 / KCTC 22515 / FYK2301M01) TaxID=1142394 RepID=I0IBI3_PHYMF|nr:hypothetical protein [Phycisphaera mikurensis]MBB6442848.1 hypothetical protein [Phycisphaera mikurensis]BAM02621.1 hypothetical protein PSMK_04620 [Phycisphaera mikurensis NBRC 102666]
MRFRWPAILVFFCVPVAAPAEPLRQAEVEAAIAVLKADLYAMQDARTGGWYGAYDKSPKLNDPKDDELLTVTATLALLRSGDSPDVEPRLRKAVERVEWGADRPEEVASTQVVGTRAEIWPLLPGDGHAARLQSDGLRLLRAASAAATFEALLTDEADAEDWNHRMTQYAVAGIAEAQDAGLKVPDRFWKTAAEHFMETQSPSGGWSYSPDTEPNAAMTCAGLSVLLTARAEVAGFVNAERPKPELERAIARGLAYLDGELGGDKTVYGGSGYLFYGLEQVALRTGRRLLGGTDWFQEMGRYVVDRALAGGDPVHRQVVNASWFLMFLARGEVPIVFNKLSLGHAVDAAERGKRPGAGAPDAAGRPNDVAFLTAWLSDAFESELNWQAVSLDEPVEALLTAPAALLLLDGAWAPEPAQLAKLRSFLDLGGLLLVVPAGRTAAKVKAAVASLAGSLTPAGAAPLTLEPVPEDHAALGLWRKPDRPTRFFRLHNGARDLVLLAMNDLGRDWQRGRRADDAMAVGANLHLLTSGYGPLPPRVSGGFPAEPDAPAGESGGAETVAASVAVVRCGPLVGREAGLWEATRRRLAAEGRATLEVRSVAAEALGVEAAADADAEASPLDGVDLLHVVGAGEAPAAAPVIVAASAFARAGGTVLVESLGGASGFAAATEAALAAALGAAPGPLDAAEGLLDADEAVPGTADLRRVAFRPFSIQRFGAGTAPTLTALSLAGRAAVVSSAEDLSLGALGVRQWGVHGYTPGDAGRLARNLVLHAAARRPSPAAAPPPPP